MALESNLVTKEDIAAGLLRLGVRPGMGLMVHSSLKSFGRVAGGAETVIAALMEAVTPAGTIMMPSFNHGAPFKPGGAGCFNPNETPTTNGLIPETFRRRADVCRSLSPTHAFAAWGKHARRYTEYHHRTLTMGENSPLGLLYADGGYGLLIGVHYGANTFHHVVETIMGAPCLGARTEAYPVVLPDGRKVEGRSWGWRERPCPHTDAGGYGGLMAARGLQKVTTVGGSRLILFCLADCFTVIAEILRDGRDGFPPCGRCETRPRNTLWTVPSDWDGGRRCLRPDSPAWGY